MTIVCLDDSPEPAAAPELLFGDVDELLDRMAALDERQLKSKR
jgi:hypothetical protein